MKTIVFDIDDVLTEETEFMRRFAPTYLHKVYGWDVSVVNPNGYELSEVYGIKDILVILGYTEADAEMKARKISQKFWNKHFIKSNRVFRVVNSSGSYIQPFSIVWIPENKVIRNKVIVTFGYPINSEKRSVNELNEMWETVQKNNIQRSNTFIEKLLEIDTKNCNLSEKRKNAKCLMKELMD